jgi:hypothetical protein
MPLGDRSGDVYVSREPAVNRVRDYYQANT